MDDTAAEAWNKARAAVAKSAFFERGLIKEVRVTAVLYAPQRAGQQAQLPSTTVVLKEGDEQYDTLVALINADVAAKKTEAQQVIDDSGVPYAGPDATALTKFEAMTIAAKAQADAAAAQAEILKAGQDAIAAKSA